MEKFRALFLTAIAQLGYAAILLQAFLIPPPLKSFRPCGCTIVGPRYVEQLILLNQRSASETGEKDRGRSKTIKDDKFCPKADLEESPPVLKNLQLEDRLQQLLFKHSAQVALCITLDPKGNVRTARTRSDTLGEGDLSLVGQYVVENWKFMPGPGAVSALDQVPHRMTLAVRQEAVW
jgi:hypothetical protein